MTSLDDNLLNTISLIETILIINTRSTSMQQLVKIILLNRMSKIIKTLMNLSKTVKLDKKKLSASNKLDKTHRRKIKIGEMYNKNLKIQEMSNTKQV